MLNRFSHLLLGSMLSSHSSWFGTLVGFFGAEAIADLLIAD
jgi:hypothetical protein